MLESSTEFPWHQSTWNQFSDARTRNHLPHALLIVGEAGIGKRNFAYKLVKSLLCLKPIDNQSCNQCNACKTYESNANPDYREIRVAEDKKQISVDQIRNMSKFITLSRSFEAFRVILLHPVEAMNMNAANSLLKSLEEPAHNTIIILLATNINRILPTIKSRCQILSLPMPTTPQALDWLQKNAPELSNAKERIDMSFGRPLLAFEIKDEDFNRRNELAEDILHVVHEEKSITEIAKKWEKIDFQSLLDWQASWVQIFIKEGFTEVSNADVQSTQLKQNLNKIKDLITTEEQWKLYQKIIEQQKYIHTSVNPLIFIENVLILWFQASHHCRSSG